MFEGVLDTPQDTNYLEKRSLKLKLNKRSEKCQNDRRRRDSVGSTRLNRKAFLLIRERNMNCIKNRKRYKVSVSV